MNNLYRQQDFCVLSILYFFLIDKKTPAQIIPIKQTNPPTKSTEKEKECKSIHCPTFYDGKCTYECLILKELYFSCCNKSGAESVSKFPQDCAYLPAFTSLEKNMTRQANIKICFTCVK